jgi:hypothetical protein
MKRFLEGRSFRDKRSLIIVVTCLALSTPCSAQIGSLLYSVGKMANSAAVRTKSATLKRKPAPYDSLGYARYYIYRSGSFLGSALSCLVYDNNEYVPLSNVQTFIKVDSVLAGDHLFTSRENGRKPVKCHFERGKTYILLVAATSNIKAGRMIVMSPQRVQAEIDKGLFFQKQFALAGLSVRDISY